ncbi:DUF692 domain-containing protein [Shewanella yunxiaonensis]|uniref:UPF0276 protein KDN34_01820 n=1 Tax=Shewanella yunxiaonensis TaxID=2829809 RepID=A0ABX7YXG1_9GAMM|nr:DUF692 domain-containing protein [Shewanella yunxiaonensis]QUN07485.1 DUF692 domain-containing protein [Shewanella yunxiaonensis]
MQMPQGAGLGLRRQLLDEVLTTSPTEVDFWELAPENWLGLRGRYAKQLARVSERYPLICHGLSLSIGGPDPLDMELLASIKRFMQQNEISIYSEHLSYCSADGHLYDLLPIPFTPAAVTYVVTRIQQVQDYLRQPLILENASYYLAPGAEMTELEFLLQVQQRSGCQLLLDVNNTYVNACNHDYDPLAFIQALPSAAISYLHMAGHFREDDGLLIDTHGASVIDPVWCLLQQTYAIHGVKPTLLERDFNIPPLTQLLTELAQITTYQHEVEEVRDAS